MTNQEKIQRIKEALANLAKDGIQAADVMAVEHVEALRISAHGVGASLEIDLTWQGAHETLLENDDLGFQDKVLASIEDLYDHEAA